MLSLFLGCLVEHFVDPARLLAAGVGTSPRGQEWGVANAGGFQL